MNSNEKKVNNHATLGVRNRIMQIKLIYCISTYQHVFLLLFGFVRFQFPSQICKDSFVLCVQFLDFTLVKFTNLFRRQVTVLSNNQ